jgi:Fungal specific transcription factor domain/Fungal Zn(2)-Cys(6) binuclear cluster domain
MQTIGTTTAADDEANDVTSGLGSSSRKRKRKTFACVVCRRRKLKCDQEWPKCSRCLKSGIECIYGREESEELGDPEATVSANAAATAAVGQALPLAPRSIAFGSTARRGESAASFVRATFPLTRPSELESTRDGVGFPIHPAMMEEARRSGSERGPPETMVFKGRDFKTQFYGATSPISPIIHFPELRTFMTKGLSGGVSLARMQNDVRALKGRRSKNENATRGKVEEADLVAMLPDQSTATRWARLYFDEFESTYRVLHGPSFWTEFHQLSENPSSAKLSFLAILVLVLAIGRVIDPQDTTFRYVGPSSSSREKAIDAFLAAQSWLDHHSKKHTTMEFFQVHVLLHVLKHIAIIKKKRIWEDSRAMITNAQAAGLHRDPSLLAAKISVFHQEMRRRIWATIVELELQASLERGMLASTTGLRWDCQAPSNIDDEDMTKDMESLPIPKEENYYTGGSFLNWCQRSLKLRIALNAALNDSPCLLSHDQMFEYEEKIKHMIEELPNWNSKAADITINKHQEIAKTVLEVQLNQYLVLIHGYFISNPGTTPQQIYSTIANLNAASDVISQYRSLSLSGSFLHQLLNYDILRVGLSICQTVCISKAFEESKLLQNLIPPSINSVEQSLSLFQDCVLRIGQGFKEYWYLSAALSVLQTRNPTRSNIDQQQAAVDRIAALYYRVLGSQEEMWTEGAISRPPADGTVASLPNGTGAVSQQTFAQQPLSEETTPLNNYQDVFSGPDAVSLFAMMDMSNWTLEDAWNFDFQQ